MRGSTGRLGFADGSRGVKASAATADRLLQLCAQPQLSIFDEIERQFKRAPTVHSATAGVVCKPLMARRRNTSVLPFVIFVGLNELPEPRSACARVGSHLVSSSAIA